MLVVAGPPGSGKSTFFPIAAMGVDAFSIDVDAPKSSEAIARSRRMCVGPSPNSARPS
jgi:adenylate kinase family enzyme